MITITAKQNCTGCHACSSVCRHNSITMVSDNEGFLYPVVNMEKCVDCGMCESVCPVMHGKESVHKIQAYGCRINNMSIRMDSSSGGVFSLLATEIIARHGVVFGAGFDEVFHVHHNFTMELEGLSEFRGSKYVQSEIGNVYQKAEAFLKQGGPVLFSGTPCQIAGLRAYLQQDYSNLFCMDLICHGVPSPSVWEKYINFREAEAGSKVKQISFRRKNLGWKLYSLSFLYEDNKRYSKPVTKDMYLQGFLRNLYLRPSCHACRFKTISRQSDITLADLWGIQSVLPELDDDKGTSLVLIHTDKGRDLFDNVEGDMQYKEVETDSAIRFNSAAVQSCLPSSDREAFFDDLNCLPLKKVMKKYCKDSIVTSGKNVVRKVCSKINRTILRKRI